MRLTDHLRILLTDSLDRQRIFVWYDGERAFGDFVASFRVPGCRMVSATGSRLRARREAESIYRDLATLGPSSDSPASLLIYLPYARSTGDDRQEDPFEGFAVIGRAFGDNEAERLESLACKVMPDLVDQVHRLFREGRPTLAILDRLEQEPSYPLVCQALGTRSVAEATLRVLVDPQAVQSISELQGCGSELERLLGEGLGCVFPADVPLWEARRKLLARYILFSELAFDLLDDVPAALSHVPRADATHQEIVISIAGRLRDSTSYREVYLDLATEVERTLRLPEHFVDRASLGEHDTFAFQERQQLIALAQALDADDLAAARVIVMGRKNSIWRHQPERRQIWNTAERCVDLLEAARQAEATQEAKAISPGDFVTLYARPDGWSDLDRRQRLMEQSIAECVDVNELEPVIVRCRAIYRRAIDAMQALFLTAIEQRGWPPEGILRQAETFDSFIAPALAAREKVVYVLSDSLRFEMGRDLAGALEELGDCEIRPTAATLPTVTAVGMAALMPGAAGALSLRKTKDTAIPYLGETPLPGLPERSALLADRFGDRVVDVELSEFLSLPSAVSRQSRLRNADLVILRDTRIDSLGERETLREVRKRLSDLLGDIKAAVAQLVRFGYRYVVIATDHGHVLLPEILPGDVVAAAPDGEWALRKRRSLLGSQVREKSGTRVFNALHLGIHGDLHELVVPSGYGVYSSGTGYFHGGISLQECVLPVVTLRARQQPDEQGGYQVQINYRSDRYTSRVIGLKVWFNSLLTPKIRARVEAFEGTKATARKVGEAADCDARDEVTHEVTLVAGQETPVPVLLDPDFRGDRVEIRVTSAETPVVWARLALKNAMLD